MTIPVIPDRAQEVFGSGHYQDFVRRKALPHEANEILPSFPLTWRYDQ